MNQKQIDDFKKLTAKWVRDAEGKPAELPDDMVLIGIGGVGENHDSRLLWGKEKKGNALFHSDLDGNDVRTIEGGWFVQVRR